MKHSLLNRFSFASIIAFVFSLMITANAFAAVDMFLKIEGISGEGTYKAKIDPATGNVDFQNIPSGHYKTTLLLSDGSMSARRSPGASDSHPSTIEISSFSWGATNSSIGSQSCGAGAGKVSMNDLNVTSSNTHVSGYSLSSGGDNPSESISFNSKSSPQTGGFTTKRTLTVRKAGGDQENYYKVILEDIIISGSAVKAGYNVKANVKC